LVTTVLIVPYRAEWPDRFHELRRIFSDALGPVALAIEHVGSTSVPGLAAKPIIDIDIVIRSRAELPEVTKRLAAIGYRHQGDLGITGREAFVFEGREERPAHNPYVCASDSAELARHLKFRDWLRANPSGVEKYAALKRELGSRHPLDRDAYTRGKTEFVEAALRRQ
jgi:GrpB-like predicted nucleotidyltransferase (UPF0157 family)